MDSHNLGHNLGYSRTLEAGLSLSAFTDSKGYYHALNAPTATIAAPAVALLPSYYNCFG